MSNISNGPRAVADQTPPGDETVARLLRLAGHRPEIPEADAAIVKEAARAEWLRTVKMERQRARFYQGAGALLALAATVMLAVNTDLGDGLWRRFTPPVARVAVVHGDASGLEAGAELWSGDSVATSKEADSRIALQMRHGASVRLDAGSRLQLQSDVVLQLESGAIYVDSQGSSVEIKTPFGVVTNVGTQFEVRLAPDHSELRVRVRQGVVVFDDGVGQPHTLTVRDELVAGTDGPVSPQVIPTCGAQWQWIEDVAPQFAGRTVGDALEWVAAEKGLELRFVPASLAADVLPEKLGGTEWAALSPADALATVALSASLSTRIEDCTLVVTLAGA